MSDRRLAAYFGLTATSIIAIYYLMRVAAWLMLKAVGKI